MQLRDQILAPKGTHVHVRTVVVGRAVRYPRSVGLAVGLCFELVRKDLVITQPLVLTTRARTIGQPSVVGGDPRAVLMAPLCIFECHLRRIGTTRLQIREAHPEYVGVFDRLRTDMVDAVTDRRGRRLASRPHEKDLTRIVQIQRYGSQVGSPGLEGPVGSGVPLRVEVCVRHQPSVVGAQSSGVQASITYLREVMLRE